MTLSLSGSSIMKVRFSESCQSLIYSTELYRHSLPENLFKGEEAAVMKSNLTLKVFTQKGLWNHTNIKIQDL